MSLKIDKITVTVAFLSFSAHQEESVDCAKNKPFQFEEPSTGKNYQKCCYILKEQLKAILIEEKEFK